MFFLFVCFVFLLVIRGVPSLILAQTQVSASALVHLVHWCTGALVHLVHQCTGSPGAPVHQVHWFTWFTGSPGSLVHLVHRCTGSPGAPVHWFTWFTGSPVHLVHLVHRCSRYRSTYLPSLRRVWLMRLISTLPHPQY